MNKKILENLDIDTSFLKFTKHTKKAKISKVKDHVPYAHQEIIPPANRAQGERRSDASWRGHIYHTHTDMSYGSSH